MTCLLIDGDYICFRAASPADGRCYTVGDTEFKYKKEAVAYCEEAGIDIGDIELSYNPEPQENAKHNAKLLMAKIFAACGSEEHIVFLKGDGNNYRKQIDPNYKLHRKDLRRPFHEQTVTDYLLKHYTVEQVDGCEVDDALGYNQTDETMIVSHDKDLLMVAGKHCHAEYDGTFTLKEVSSIDGKRFFYQQLLTGDSVDNIPGIRGIGPKTAKKLLKDTETEEEMFAIVKAKYAEKEIPEERMLMNANLLYILREEGQMWEAPIEKEENSEEEGNEETVSSKDT